MVLTRSDYIRLTVVDPSEAKLFQALQINLTVVVLAVGFVQFAIK